MVRRMGIEAANLVRSAPQPKAWLRSFFIALVCLAGAGIFLVHVDTIYPIKDWLFIKLAMVWGACLYLHAGAVAVGHALLSRVIKVGGLPFYERLLTDMAVGLVSFVLLMYAAGACGLLRSEVAVVLPGALMLVSLPTLIHELKQHRARPSTPGARARYHPLVVAGAVLALLAVGVLYLQCMTPDALNYDSKWYHLTVGEDYAREGRLVPFPADYNKAAFPQLTGFLYAWSSLLPGFDTPLRAMFILHNEFCLMLWQMLAVRACVDWFLGKSSPGAWAAMFLFPGFYIYDSNLGGSADHVLGFFAVPLFLAAVRASESFALRRCALVGILAGGAVLTKYQAVYLIVGVTPIIAGRWLWLVLHRSSRERLGRWLWQGPLSIIVCCLLVASPHFLKSLVFYGNPIYPYFATSIKSSHPLQPDAGPGIANLWMDNTLVPKGSVGSRALRAIELIFTFSFDTHCSIPRPVYGSLFSLLLPTLPFVRNRSRIVAGAVALCGALFFWGYTYLVDRYLQALLALVSAVTAALIVRAYQAGWFSRIAVIALVLVQVVWSGDNFFLNSYNRIADSIELIRSGHEGKAATRFDKYMRATRLIDERLPPNAVLLFHNTRLALGVNRRVYQDLAGFQSLISYTNARNARDIVAMYRSFGITHIVHERGSWKALTRQEEVLFAMFLQHYVKDGFRAHEFEVLALPAELPPVEPTYRTLSLGLDGYADGIYPVDAMHVLEPLPNHLRHYPAPDQPVDRRHAEAAAGSVDAVLMGPGISPPPELGEVLDARFEHIFSFNGELHVYVRK